MHQLRPAVLPGYVGGLLRNIKGQHIIRPACMRHSSSSDDREYLHRSKVPTYHFQRSLPHLPIPKLEDTCQRYLQAQRPLLSEASFAQTEAIVKEFQHGEGKDLNQRLVAWDKKNKSTSYISEPWFDMYLKDRRPIVLNHNPFISFNDDPKPEYNNQLLRATNMVMSSSRFLKTLRAEILEPEVFHLNPQKSDTPGFRRFVRLLPQSLSWYGAYLYKAFPLDMSQYHRLFNGTRIPRPEKDELFVNPEGKNICVIRNGHIYSFDVFDRDGNILPAGHIMANIAAVLADPRPQAEHPVGILTSENRSTWSNVLDKLHAAGNADKLHEINSALFVLSLEDTKSEDFIELSRLFLHGGNEGKGWFDKSFTVIMTGTGKCAVNFEHAWGDGVAVLRYVNEVFKDTTEKPQVHPDTQPSVGVDTSSTVRRLDEIKNDIFTAKANFAAAIKDLDLQYLLYEKFGKGYIKNQKLSPDSFMQLAFQMAYYRQNKQTTATYESCSTAAYKHGRTETIRPATTATLKASQLINRSNHTATLAEMKEAIVECSKVHGQLTKEAAMGQGFDRHLFGLKHTATKEGLPLPKLHQDPSYAAINYNILSTSTLSSPAVLLGGFAPVVPDGYGLGYGVEDKYLGANVTCYKPHRDVKEFLGIMAECFDDLHAVLEGREFRK